MSRVRTDLVLGVVQTDRTFERMELRGSPVWCGKCIHCNRRLCVGLDGALLDNATLEHIRPRNHGGGDDLGNLALACARCNHQKGYRLDHRPATDPDAARIIEATLKRREKRWRKPLAEDRPIG